MKSKDLRRCSLLALTLAVLSLASCQTDSSSSLFSSVSSSSSSSSSSESSSSASSSSSSSTSSTSTTTSDSTYVGPDTTEIPPDPVPSEDSSTMSPSDRVPFPNEVIGRGDVNIHFYSQLGGNYDSFYFWKSYDIGATGYSFPFRSEKESVEGLEGDYLFDSVSLFFGTTYSAYRNFYLEDGDNAVVQFSISEDDFFSGFLGYDTASDPEGMIQSGDASFAELEIVAGMDIYAVEKLDGTIALATTLEGLDSILHPDVTEPVGPEDESERQDFNIFFYSAYGSESRNQVHLWGTGIEGVDFPLVRPTVTFPELGNNSYVFSRIYLDFDKTYTDTNGQEFQITAENLFDGFLVNNSEDIANDKTIDLSIDKERLVQNADGSYDIYVMEYFYGEVGTTIYYSLEDVRKELPKNVADETEGDVNIHFFSTYASSDSRDLAALYSKDDRTNGFGFDMPAYTESVEGLPYLFSTIHLNFNMRYKGYNYDGSSMENTVYGDTFLTLESLSQIDTLKVGNSTNFGGDKTLELDLSSILNDSATAPVDVYVIELDYSSPMIFSEEELQDYIEAFNSIRVVNFYFTSPSNWDMLYLWGTEIDAYSFYGEDVTLEGTDLSFKQVTLVVGEERKAASAGWFDLATSKEVDYTLTTDTIPTMAIVRSSAYTGDNQQSADLALPTPVKDVEGVVNYYIVVGQEENKPGAAIYTSLSDLLSA